MKKSFFIFLMMSLPLSAFANTYRYQCVSSGNANLPDGNYRLVVDGNTATVTHVRSKRWLTAEYSPYFYTFVTPDENGGSLFEKRHHGYMGLKTFGKAKITWIIAYRISRGYYQNNALHCTRVR